MYIFFAFENIFIIIIRLLLVLDYFDREENYPPKDFLTNYKAIAAHDKLNKGNRFLSLPFS